MRYLIRFLMLGFLLVATSWGQDVVMEMPGSPLDIKTGMIMNSAAGIEASMELLTAQVKKIEGHTRSMRAVQEARQKVILALAQMRLLQEHGLVLQRMGPATEIVEQVEAFWTKPEEEPEPLSLEQMPAMSSLKSVMNDFKGLLNDSLDLYDQSSNLAGAVQDIGSGASYHSNGLLGLAESGWTVLDEGTKAAQTAVGMYYKVEHLIWTGRQFLGTNWGHIDNIVGLLGTTIDLDREIPATILPVTQRLALTLQKFRSADQQFASAEKSPFVRDSNAAQRESAYRLADAMYLRPKSPLDGAWVRLVTQQGGVSAAQFYAAISESQGMTYDPVIGYFKNGERKNTFNLNNGLSGGAQFAITQFYVDHRKVGMNPFDRFAKTVAPVLDDILLATKVGSAVSITTEDLRRARSEGTFNLLGYQKIDEGVPVLDIWNGELREQDFMRCGIEEEQGNVLVIKPPTREQDEYGIWVRANDGELRRNRRQINMAIAMLNYYQAAMEASSHLRAALQGIAEKLTASSAVESIPVMIQSSDHFIAYLQQMIAWYGNESGRLQQEQHDLLARRARYVQGVREELQRTASLRVASLLSQKGIPQTKQTLINL